MTATSTILVVDDEPSMLSYLRTVLELDSFRVETVNSGLEAINRVKRGTTPDLVLLDLHMPGMSGFDTLSQLRSLRPRLKVVIISCDSDTPQIVQAIRMGADDYLTKPFRRDSLDAIINKYLKRQLEEENNNEAEIIELGDNDVFLCASPEMRKVRLQAALVAKVDIPVLLLGESGTGKEVVAKLIHKLSPRAHRNFLKVNCAAVPAALLESELFGYESGAFTGATKPKPGKFELCNNGTILLDEIGEMPPAMQAKLLHVLQDGQFSRLGSRNVVQVDVRILAATNINMPDAITSKSFREDLYYRLNGFALHLPPLRERKQEIPYLLQHFVSRIAARYGRSVLPLSKRLIQVCQAHPWNGNLRELENFVKRYVVLGDEDAAIGELQPQAAVDSIRSMGPATQVKPRSPNGVRGQDGGLKSLVRSAKDDTEIEAIREALQQTNWNRSKAAPLLKISYKALLYKIRQYDLHPPNGQNADQG